MVDVANYFVVYFCYNICIVLLFDQLRTLLTVKILQNVIHDKLFYYIYQVLKIHYFKIGHPDKTP